MTVTVVLPQQLHAFLEKDLKFSEKSLDALSRLWPHLEAENYSTLYEDRVIRTRGKQRQICAPVAELKDLQRLLMRRFWYRIRVSKHAHGFHSSRSPITNAKVHIRSGVSPKAVLAMDVKDFFPSVTLAHTWKAADTVLRARFRHLELDEIKSLSESISMICIKEGALPQGAPSSPAITNIYMSPFDRKMAKYCKKYKLIYTRYADDIVISGRTAHRARPKVLVELKQMGLEANPRKTRVLRNHRAQSITGVVVNSGESTVSRKYRRRLRAAIHQTKMTLQGKANERARPESVTRLRGMAQWIASVNQRHTHFLEQVESLNEQRS